MACSACSRLTLHSFIRVVSGINQASILRATSSQISQKPRQLSTAVNLRRDAVTQNTGTSESVEPRTSRDNQRTKSTGSKANIVSLASGQNRAPKRNVARKPRKDESSGPKPSMLATTRPAAKREHWQIQKAALKEKFEGEGWNPRKKLSPDAMEGIRHLHKAHPDKFTLPILADHFKVSPEAIRRILKSKWRPSAEEQEERLKRWDKRGEKIWANLVELGVKPPKKWREMGVGKAKHGDVPKWKTRWRNRVAVNDSVSDDIIPIVDDRPRQPEPLNWQRTPIAERII